MCKIKELVGSLAIIDTLPMHLEVFQIKIFEFYECITEIPKEEFYSGLSAIR